MAAHDLPDAHIAFTTVGSVEEARRLARLLVEREVAACVQLLPIESVYRWEGTIHEEPEVLLLVKAPRSSYEAVEAVISEHHPYETPELLFVEVDGGLPSYLRWLAESTTAS